jgi:hypothetical protein
VKLVTAAACAIVVLSATLAATARGDVTEYGIQSANATVSTLQAGGHPDFTTSFSLKREANNELPSSTRETIFELPPGLLANPTAVPACTAAQFITTDFEQQSSNLNGCPIASQVGIVEVELFNVGGPQNFVEPVYNLEPGPGEPARLGFIAKAFPVFINTRLRSDSDYGVTASSEEVGSLIPLLSATTTIWAVPADESHDGLRITPFESLHNGGVPETPDGRRTSDLAPKPYMLNPTRCGVLQGVRFIAIPYASPALRAEAVMPLGTNFGCGLLEFSPSISLKPTTVQADAGSGLEVDFTSPTEKVEDPKLLAEDEMKRAEVMLPAGVTVNPSAAEGLGACSEADFKAETASSGPGEDCPQSSKIGTVTATSPLLDETAEGSLYVAKPYENPFGTLLALYMVIKIPDRGVIVKLPGKVVADANTGQIVVSFGEAPYEIPQLPVSAFHLHFHEGARAPLVMPSTCGTYTSTVTLTSWGGHVLTIYPSFQVTQGASGGACPSGGMPPLAPDFLAGSLDNAAGHYSPFNVRLSREDGEQEITRFSLRLPPGVIGKLAGIPLCPDSAIEAARARTGPSGGQEELERPICPSVSEIGHTLVGGGVGKTLAYVPGRLYLAGPYRGSSISVVAITAAKIGPFDLGTIVVREALEVEPETGDVIVGRSGSDRFPHIIEGIPTRLKDIRAYLDRSDFMLNPTSCEPMSTTSTVFGAGLDFSSEADDVPVTVTSPFQAADCSALTFRPRLKLSLRGKTRRGGNPAFHAELTQAPGEASVGRARVTLPGSEFLDNVHLDNFCTRVQFKQGAGNGARCPAGSVYGHAKAITPILSEALSGPVYLRSNPERELPDLVAALHSDEIDIDLVGHVEGTKGGGIRTTFETIPDAPVSRFILDMDGGRKGLLQNSTNVCVGAHRAMARLTGHNAKHHKSRPPLKASCDGRKHRGRRHANR